MTDKTEKLLKRLKDSQERHSIVGLKPQGLSQSEIQERVEDFLIFQVVTKIPFSFGGGVSVGGVVDTDTEFDPIQAYQDHPEAVDDIMMYVRSDMSGREDELLEEAKTHMSSYNVLLFGTAMAIANGEALSVPLREFLVDHLTKPPRTNLKARGRPRLKDLDAEFRYYAIRFAMLHGPTPTRNDASSPHSACDIVAGAALALRKSGRDGFAIGYGYDNLKRIWQKYSKQ